MYTKIQKNMSNSDTRPTQHASAHPSSHSGFKLTSLTKQERTNVQKFIRSKWKSKSAQNPFLGVDTVQVRGNSSDLSSVRSVRMTQEQYATFWIKWTLMEQRRQSKDD
jgi:hypothetical protein